MTNLWKGSNNDRLADQEAIADAIAARMDLVPARGAGQGSQRQVRIAVTAPDPTYSTYPYTDAPIPPLAYWIIFVDVLLDDASGMDGTPPTVNNRQNSPLFRAYNLVGACVPVGSPVVVLEQNGEWFIISPSAGQVLLGKWLGSATHGTVGTTVWEWGTTQPVEIFAGPTPGGETDQNVWLTVMNYYGPVMPVGWVMIGWNGYGWYLLGAADTLLLGKYVSSGGNPSYWKPGTSASVILYGTDAPTAEIPVGVTVTGVWNRFGPIAPGFVWIAYSTPQAQWYAVAEQGQSLLCKYIGEDPWFYGTACGSGNLKVWGGQVQGTETDQSWALPATCWNWNEDIVPTADVETPWVWVSTNGYRSDQTSDDVSSGPGCTLNWYVVQDASEKPMLDLGIYGTSPSLVDDYDSFTAIQWIGTNVAFTTADNKSWTIPDNRKYLVTVSLQLAPAWTPIDTSGLGDFALCTLSFTGTASVPTFADPAITIGYFSMLNFSFDGSMPIETITQNWLYQDFGPQNLVTTFVIDDQEGETIELSIRGMPNGDSTGGYDIGGKMTVIPFDQG